MAKLAIIALFRPEHRHLAQVWKFFPFRKDTDYLYLHAGSEDELPRHERLAAISFSGQPREAVSSIQKYLQKHKLTRLCFASLASYRLWAEVLGLPSISLYGSKKLSLADVSGLAEGTMEEIVSLVSLLRKTPAVLSGEAGSFAHPPDSNVYPDFNAWQKTGFGELLLTRNQDLVSAVCASRLPLFSLSHYQSGLLHANLAIDEENPDFLQTLIRLDQAADLARHNPESSPLPPDLQLPAQTSYSLFAEYYDTYMSHVNYEEWVDLMLTWYKQFSKQPARKVLELACGTANAAEILVFRGFEVDACDKSPHMLHKADTKAFKPNLFLNSLTDPLPRKDYDFIFCLFDSINYLTQKAAIKTLLKNVREALRPGGIFIFDISTLFNSLDNFNNTTNFTRVKDGYLVQISTFEALSNRQITHLMLFRRSLSGYDRLEERHAQRVYRSPELAELTASSGLKLKAIFNPEMRTNLLQKMNADIDERYYRLFFLLQKDE
ncbi:MAG: class I SAM-dependent methyltransferase [Candidatus Syntrophosphaera sp.]|nr:class I SAM-dependent methyltransferase [Candidatus Syntrophosphaera sp.]